MGATSRSSRNSTTVASSKQPSETPLVEHPDCEAKHQEIVAARQRSYENGLRFSCPICKRVVHAIKKTISKNISIWIISK